jgi:hypothetical protein
MMKMHSKKMIDWITGWPWQAFVTLTFRYPRISEERAQNMLRA